MGHPGEAVGGQVFRSGPAIKGAVSKALETPFWMVIKSQNYTRSQIQYKNERLYNTLILLLKYFLIAGKATFGDDIINPRHLSL